MIGVKLRFLEVAILTAVVVVSLTVYTFWAARRGHDFSFPGPFVFATVILLVVFSFIQVNMPVPRLTLIFFQAF